jgi:hypothetical protein
MNPEKKNLALSPEAVKAIEDILKRRNHAEVKIEDGSVVIIEIHRKKRI